MLFTGLLQRWLFKGQRWAYLCLTIILCLGVGLRFWGITSQGLLAFDEAGYVLTGETLTLVLKEVHANLDGIVSGKVSLGQLVAGFRGLGYLPRHHPGFYTLLVVSQLTAGIHDYSGKLVVAVSGLLTLWLVFIVGKRIGDEALGLIAAALLCVSPYYLYYTRVGWAQATAGFFVILGVAVYLGAFNQSREEIATINLILAGLSLGYAFSVHYTTLLHLFALETAEILRVSIRVRESGKSLPRALYPLALLNVAALVPILFFEVATVVSLRWIRPTVEITSGRPAVWPSFLGRLTEVVFSFGQGSLRLGELTYYVRYLSAMDGPLLLISLAAGLLVVARRILMRDSAKCQGLLVVGLQFLIPFVFWSLPFVQVPRTLASALPFVALVSGAGLLATIEYIVNALASSNRALTNLLAGLCVAGIALAQFGAIRQVVTTRSEYRQAIAYIEGKGGSGHLSTNEMISSAYIGARQADSPGEDLAALKQVALPKGYRYLLVDFRRYVLPSYKVVSTIEQRCLPVHVVDNPSVLIPVVIADDAYSYSAAQSIRGYPDTSVIKIYDLANCLPEFAAQGD